MEYLIIKDGKIAEHCCSSELPEGATQIDSFNGIVGEPTTYYNDDWTRKSDIELYKENILSIPTGYKLNDDKTAIVEMSQVEKINAGIETRAAGFKISGDSVIEKTNAEKLADNEITQSEYAALVQKQYKEKVVELIREKYSTNDEYDMINAGIANSTDEEYIAYRNYVSSCKCKAKEELEI